MTKYIQIEILKDLNNFVSGKTIKVLADKNGVPFNSFWRKRIKDSEKDGCCRVVTDKISKSKRSKKAED